MLETLLILSQSFFPLASINYWLQKDSSKSNFAFSASTLFGWMTHFASILWQSFWANFFTSTFLASLFARRMSSCWVPLIVAPLSIRKIFFYRLRPIDYYTWRIERIELRLPWRSLLILEQTIDNDPICRILRLRVEYEYNRAGTSRLQNGDSSQT